MLTSITALGERSRGSRWGTTVTAFALGSVIAGAALGAALGALGDVVGLGGVSDAFRLGILALALTVGVAIELGLWGLSLPSSRRQVNEDWLNAFRGWVYGLGFGAQLGLGVVTVTTSSGVYLTFIASFLVASPGPAAIIGGLFGLVRAAAILPGGRVHEPGQLMALGAAIRRWESPSRRWGIAWQSLLAVVALAATAGATG